MTQNAGSRATIRVHEPSLDYTRTTPDERAATRAIVHAYLATQVTGQTMATEITARDDHGATIAKRTGRITSTHQDRAAVVVTDGRGRTSEHDYLYGAIAALGIDTEGAEERAEPTGGNRG